LYVAGYGGMFRSNDGGATFTLAYYSTEPRKNDILQVEIDPFAPDTGYLSTADGAFVTTRLSESRIEDFQPLSPMRSFNLINLIFAFTRDQGYLYVLNRADLYYISYASNGPERYVSESWDGGQTWKVLFMNATAGDLQWYGVDPEDPDTLWIAASRAVVK